MSLAVFGGERIAEHGHFLNGINRRRQRQIVEPQRPDVDAVHGVIRRAVTATLDRHVLVPAAARRAELRPAIEGLRCHARRQRGERQERPPVDRHVFDLLAGDGLADHRAVCLDEWRLANHRDGFGDARRRERNRRPRGLAIAHRERRQLRGLKSRDLDPNAIGRRREARHRESSFPIRRDDALGVGPAVDDRDCGARDATLARVQHLTHDPRRGRLLRVNDGGAQAERDQQKHQTG